MKIFQLQRDPISPGGRIVDNPDWTPRDGNEVVLRFNCGADFVEVHGIYSGEWLKRWQLLEWSLGKPKTEGAS